MEKLTPEQIGQLFFEILKIIRQTEDGWIRFELVLKYLREISSAKGNRFL